jgi:hypothetical protein
VTYTVDVSVSDGATRTLLVDTGSSTSSLELVYAELILRAGNTWIGYEVEYDGTNCPDEFEVEYGSGFVFGSEVCPVSSSHALELTVLA